MGLPGLFMGYSRPYTILCGLVEVLAGCLLVWRRTATLGALVAVVAMTQVVILNSCYDVPVKLYSLELLAAAFAIAAPELRRLLIAALGRAVPEVPPRVRGPLWYERARLAGKLALLGSFCFRWYQADAPRLAQPPPSELAGAWDVAAFQLGGRERPPLATDGERYHVELARAPAPLLETRGFHWIQEEPFHR